MSKLPATSKSHAKKGCIRIDHYLGISPRVTHVILYSAIYGILTSERQLGDLGWLNTAKGIAFAVKSMPEFAESDTNALEGAAAEYLLNYPRESNKERAHGLSIYLFAKAKCP